MKTTAEATGLKTKQDLNKQDCKTSTRLSTETVRTKDLAEATLRIDPLGVELNNIFRRIPMEKRNNQDLDPATEGLDQKIVLKRWTMKVLIKTCQSLREIQCLAERSREIKGFREMICQIPINRPSKLEVEDEINNKH